MLGPRQDEQHYSTKSVLKWTFKYWVLLSRDTWIATLLCELKGTMGSTDTCKHTEFHFTYLYICLCHTLQNLLPRPKINVQLSFLKQLCRTPESAFNILEKKIQLKDKNVNKYFQTKVSKIIFIPVTSIGQLSFGSSFCRSNRLEVTVKCLVAKKNMIYQSNFKRLPSLRIKFLSIYSLPSIVQYSISKLRFQQNPQ